MLENLKVSELIKLIETLKDTKQSSSFFEIGKSYFIRTVTMHIVGKLENINDKELLLSSASWIADSGRFHTALKTGELNEIEPFVNNVIINRDCIIGSSEWIHDLPRSQK